MFTHLMTLRSLEVCVDLSLGNKYIGVTKELFIISEIIFHFTYIIVDLIGKIHNEIYYSHESNSQKRNEYYSGNID